METLVVNYGKHLFAIDQQMVRAFLIVGTEKAILLDTGAIKTDIRKHINEITDLPVEVVITHGDVDHTANLETFSEVYLWEKDKALVAALSGCENIIFHPLSNMQIIDVGGRKLQVIFTPGHTEGSVCLLDRENKILFSGDTVSYGPTFMFGKGRDMKKYLQSLEMLKDMRKEGVFDTVYCCHNSCPISGEVIDDLVNCVKEVLDETITGVPVTLPVPTSEKVMLVKWGKCGILIQDKVISTEKENGTGNKRSEKGRK